MSEEGERKVMEAELERMEGMDVGIWETAVWVAW